MAILHVNATTSGIHDGIKVIYLELLTARHPRSLTDIKRWKAPEFRTFLLYTGPIVLKRKLSETFYNNFLILHVSMRILLTKNPCSKYIEYAQELLKVFVDDAMTIYGRSSVAVYNFQFYTYSG